MKKFTFTLLLAVISLSCFSQKKDSTAAKPNEVVTAKVVADTLLVSPTTAKFIKINDRIFPASVLQTEMLPVSLEWIINVFSLIQSSKGSELTVDQIDKIRSPLYPYVEYVQKLQQQQQQKKQ